MAGGSLPRPSPSRGDDRFQHAGPGDTSKLGLTRCPLSPTSLSGEELWQLGMGNEAPWGRTSVVTHPMLSAQGDLAMIMTPGRAALKPHDPFDALSPFA